MLDNLYWINFTMKLVIYTCFSFLTIAPWRVSLRASTSFSHVTSGHAFPSSQQQSIARQQSSVLKCWSRSMVSMTAWWKWRWSASFFQFTPTSSMILNSVLATRSRLNWWSSGLSPIQKQNAVISFNPLSAGDSYRRVKIQ